MVARQQGSGVSLLLVCATQWATSRWPEGTHPMRMPLITLLTAGALLGCREAPDAFTDAERAALTDTIVQRMHDYVAAVEALDPERVAALYADDPDFLVYSDGQRFTRDSLLAVVSGMGSALRSVEATWDTIEVTPLRRDFALAAAPFRRTLTDTAGAVVHDWGTVTWVWMRRAGVWRLIHGHGVHYPDALP